MGTVGGMWGLYCVGQVSRFRLEGLASKQLVG